MRRFRRSVWAIVMACGGMAGGTVFEKAVRADGPAPAGETYTVQSGDSYSSIARKFGVTEKELMNSNPGVNPLVLPQAIRIPGAGVVSPLTAVVAANNQFAIDLFHKFNPGDSKNCFFSPYSVSSALAMTWAGARGNTATQMASALRFSEMPTKDATPAFSALQAALGRAQAFSGAQLSVANSLWPEQNPGNPFLPEYMELLHRDFGTSVTPLDFKNGAEAATKQINGWVEEKTHAKIKDLVHEGDVDASTRMVLVNAIYFKGTWEYAFDPQDTKKQADFHPAKGANQHVDLMRVESSTQYADIKDGPVPCQVLSMNYFDQGLRDVPTYDGRGLSMVVVLPRSAGDLAALEKDLTAKQIAGWLGKAKEREVDIRLPKFRIEQRYNLGETLKSLGMDDAFNSKADFSGMDGAHDLYISKVIHQAFVDVDEKGTEAAAATFIGGSANGPGPAPRPQVFRADHPFLFFIQENGSGSILFLGHFASADGN